MVVSLRIEFRWSPFFDGYSVSFDSFWDSIKTVARRLCVCVCAPSVGIGQTVSHYLQLLMDTTPNETETTAKSIHWHSMNFSYA